MKFNNLLLGCVLLTIFGCAPSDINASPEGIKSINVDKKIMEINLVDKQISDQGGVAKLSKNKSSCTLNVELLSSYNKEIYDFNFKNSELNTTSHYIYKYTNGIISSGTEDDKELQDLMAKTNEKTTEINEMELTKKETVVGNKNKNINKEFKYYLNLFPSDVISKCK